MSFSSNSPEKPPAHRRVSWPLLLAFAVFVLGFIYALRAGFMVDAKRKWHDFKYLYVIGECWLERQSPYDVPTFRAHWLCHFSEITAAAAGGIAVPPWAILWCAPVALVPFATAGLIFAALNVGAFTLSLLFTARLVFGDRSGHVPWDRPAVWVALAVCCLVGGVPASLLLGQTGIFALAGALGLIDLLRRRRARWYAPFLMLLVSMKPPIALLPVLYVALSGGLIEVLVGGLVVVALAAFLFLRLQPLEGFWKDFRDSTIGYTHSDANRPPRVGGMHSLLMDTPLSAVPPSIWILIGVALAVVLAWIYRRRACAERGYAADAPHAPEPIWFATHVALATAATTVFIPSKPYDTVLLMPALALAVRLGWTWIVALAPGLILACRPELATTALRKLGISSLMRLKEAQVMTLGALVVIVLLAILCLSSIVREKQPLRPVTPVEP